MGLYRSADRIGPYRTGRSVRQLYQFTDATLSLAEGAPAEALELFRSIEAGNCGLCGILDRAQAFEALDQPDSAIVYYEAYLETNDVQRAAFDNENRGPTLERLGQLYDESGDPEQAAVYYARFVELWTDADPELQPRVQAAQSRLEEIVRERG